MRKLTDEQTAKIRELARLPQRDIAARVGVSLSSVSKTLAAPAPKTGKAPKGVRATKAKPAAVPRARPAPTPSTEAPDDAEAEGTPLERLNAALASLQRAARQASVDGDLARVIQAQRAVGDLTALAERLRPAPAVTVDDRPDMKAAAARGRKRMHELLDRLLKEAQS
jgi:hypothetical protein